MTAAEREELRLRQARRRERAVIADDLNRRLRAGETVALPSPSSTREPTAEDDVDSLLSALDAVERDRDALRAELAGVLASPSPPAAEPRIVARVEGVIPSKVELGEDSMCGIAPSGRYLSVSFGPQPSPDDDVVCFAFMRAWPGAHVGQRVEVLVHALDGVEVPTPPAAEPAIVALLACEHTNRRRLKSAAIDLGIDVCEDCGAWSSWWCGDEICCPGPWSHGADQIRQPPLVAALCVEVPAPPASIGTCPMDGLPCTTPKCAEEGCKDDSQRTKPAPPASAAPHEWTPTQEPDGGVECARCDEPEAEHRQAASAAPRPLTEARGLDMGPHPHADRERGPRPGRGLDVTRLRRLLCWLGFHRGIEPGYHAWRCADCGRWVLD